MPQTSVGFNSDITAIAGLLVGNERVSRSVRNETGSVIAYGSMLAYTGTSKNVEIPTATGAKLAGVSFFERITEDAKDANNHYGVEDGFLFRILKQGILYVYCEEAIAINDPVYFRHTANGAGKLFVGYGFRNDADPILTVPSCDLIPATNARWVSTGVAGGFAQLSIMFP